MSVPAIQETKIDINYDDYASKPQELFALAKSYLRKKQFEEGLSILEEAIKLAIALYGNETKIEVAKFYDKYAEGIIQKLLANEEILALPNEPQQSKEEQKEGSNEEKEDKGEETDEQGQNSDEQIAFENLAVANSIYLKHLEQFKNMESNQISKENINYFLDLSDNYLNFGELEQAQSDFKKAADYFVKAIDIRKKYDEKMSRSLAELYYELSNVLDFDPKKCLLCLYKTKLMMEYHLKKAIEKHNIPNIDIKINEDDVNLESIAMDDAKIFINRQVVESKELGDKAKEFEEIDDFISILADLYLKLEDVILELKEYDQFLKEKKKMEMEKNEQSGQFTDNYDKSKVIDLSLSTVIRKKRPRTPDEDDKEVLLAQKEKVTEERKKEEDKNN